MVSGADLFISLFNNSALLIILVAVYGPLNAYAERWGRVWHRVAVGVLFGVVAIGCMHARIPVAEGVIVDQRNAVVALSGAFGGPLCAAIGAAMTSAYRVYLGGEGAIAGSVGVSLAALSGIGLQQWRTAFSGVFHWAMGAALAAVVILPGFLAVGDWQVGWALLRAMSVPYGLAIFLGIFLVGMLLAHEERRHLAERRLRESEQRFRGLFENLVDICHRTDAHGSIVLVSPSLEKVFGYRPDEVLGWPMARLDTDPARRKEFLELVLRDGKVQNFEAEMRRKDGSHVWVSTNARLLLDEDGRVVGIEGVTRDITPLKVAEEEKHRLEASLQQSRKMEAIGNLSGGIAHDFNNMLSGIIGYAELALDEIPVSSAAHQDVQEVLQAGLRAKELVRQILAFSRKGPQKRLSVHARGIVMEALRLLRATLPSTVRMEDELCECGSIVADATQVQQVVMNLCANAAQAMAAEGGLLKVSLDEVDLEDESGLPTGQYVRLSVEDTGPGIPEALLERIFEPYFTTKEVGSGSGLGLSIVHGIAQSHGGDVRVRSVLGEGTTFTVFLPKAGGSAHPDAESAGPMPGGTERILVVDDEPHVARVTHERLRHLGYSVTSTTRSTEALRLFLAEPDAFDLVVTDQTMPHLTGEQLARAMTRSRPQLPVVLCTGFGADIDLQNATLVGVVEILSKPLNWRELAMAVRRALANSPRRLAAFAGDVCV